MIEEARRYWKCGGNFARLSWPGQCGCIDDGNRGVMGEMGAG